MSLYYIQHVPTQRLYTPNNGQFRPGRNWRKSEGVFYTNSTDAVNEIDRILERHRSGEERLRIRTYGGYDAPRWEDAVGDGYIRERDFRVVRL